MANATANIDTVSAALLYAQTLEDRLSKKMRNAIARLAEQLGSDLTVEDVHECIRTNLAHAMQLSDEEFLSPDYDILRSSERDIDEGRCHDLQDVINGLSHR